jgi:glutaredoxin
MELPMIVVYSKNNCPECTKAMSLLDSKGLTYTVVKIDEKPDARDFLIAAGHKSVPQIYNDNGLVVEGGYKALTKLTDEQWAALK